jgi:hypothetical protein
MKKLFVGAFGLMAVAVLLVSVVAVGAAGGDANAARMSKGNPATLAAVQGCASASFAAAANYGTGTNPISVTTADFNKDGNLDLAVANYFANTVSVLPGNGTGGFGTKVDFVTGNRPFSVIAADFNKDGNLDLAVSNVFSFDVSVLLGNGAGGFAPKVDFITGGESRGLTTADFNKDGNLDLAVATQNSNKVAVLLGNGAGSFAPRVEYAAGTTTFFVTAGDFNEDGNPDLAVANQDSNNVSVLLGNGAAGGFAPKVDYPAGTGPRYVLTADFNNDGNLDLAVVNLDSNNISVLLGNGAGGFAPKVDYGAGANPFSMATADFNRDGNLDLAVANSNFASLGLHVISVFLGDGAGGFAPKVDFNVGNNPYSVTAGDFNKDGSPDLASANHGSNTVSVLINTCVVVPNNTPVASASPNPATTNEDTPVTIRLTGTDADDQNLIIIVTDLPDHGTLEEPVDTICSPPGGPANCFRDVIYTPAANYNGADSFKFKVNDHTVDSAEVTVNITVNAVNDLSVSDVTQSEGDAGTTQFAFTVSLDAPAPAQGVTFNIATQDGTATDANNDYEPNSATGATIPEGQSEYQFNVTVNGDTADEPNETFFVNITNPTNATIADGQGTGTILNDDSPPTAGQIIISEFRLRGAGADSANDEFIEIYNNTDEEVVVRDSSPLPDINPDGWAIISSDAPTTPKHIIPAGTRIPARGHYLVANTIGYSLSLYPSGNDGSAATTAIEDGGYNVDIPDNAGIALFRTGNPLLFLTPAERLDAVGFTASPIFAETTPLQPSTGVNIPLQHSFVRRMTTGRPQDTDNNQTDFDFVAVSQTTVSGRTPLLGAPGPENLTSPTQRNAVVKAQLVDPLCAGNGAADTACARVRTAAGANPTNAAFGTLLIRRRFRNTSGVDVTRLRFRLVDVTAGTPQAGGLADLRALSSVDVTVSNTQGFDILLHGLTLEEVSTPAPTQPGGGGLNSTLSADITLAQPLKPNVPYDVEFRLGVMVNGAFRFLVNVEALPPASPALAATGKTPNAARGKQSAKTASGQ